MSEEATANTPQAAGLEASTLPARRGATAAGLAALAIVACRQVPEPADPMDAVSDRDLGLPVLSLRWRVMVADRSDDSTPQEFASPGLAVGDHPAETKLYVGSHAGVLHALAASSGDLVWEAAIGSTSSRPVVDRGRIYIGTDDGSLVCLEASDGRENWRYTTRGPVLQPPVIADDLVLFSNEADQVYALDRETGKFRWQYKTETPEEFTLRGHAGVTVDGDLAFTGFADGTLVALRTATGSVAWIKALKGEADRFVDVDATPVVAGDRLFAASSGGGVFALDKTTGLIHWRLNVVGVGPLAIDSDRLYVAAADKGVYAVDFSGNVLWRQGTRGGGEPAQPVVAGDYLVYALSDAGLFIADKATGEVHQYFDPGYGVSATPTIEGDRLYLLSNSAILYALDLRRFD
jgi:outer membrane protein assembly factor BamB